MNSQGARIIIFLIALSLVGSAISRGVGGGGGGGNSSGGGGGGRGSGGGNRSGGVRLVTRNATPIKDVKLGKTGAYLIPAGGGNYYPLYRTAEVTSYYRREGSGMSAWGIVALILGIIGSGTVAWFCYMVGLPIWRDRQRRHSLINSNDPIRGMSAEGIPLQETPSTATPSPTCDHACVKI